MQVLYIFPLRKYGKALIAGLDGQQGLVYGTIQFNTPGPIEQLVGRLFAHSKDEGFKGALSDFVRGIFIDENVMELADKFDMDADDEFRRKAMSGNEADLSEADLQSVGGIQLDKALYRSQSAYSLSLMPRAMVDGLQRTWMPSVNEMKETIWQAVKNRYYINNVKDWVVNPNLKNLIYIEDDKNLKPYFEAGYLRTLPQVILEKGSFGTADTDNIAYYSIHMPRGELKEVVAVKRTEKQNTGDAIVLDVPYTSLEGIKILDELCSYIANNSGFFAKPDKQENEQNNKDTSIIISSALIVGSAHPLYGSGFHLILTGTGKLGEDKVLLKFVQKYYDILCNKLKSSNQKYEHLPLFTIDKDITKQNEVGINIGVPSPFGNNIAANEEEKAVSVPKDTETTEEIKRSPLSNAELTQHVFYSDLDSLGRCHKAYARITYADVVNSKKKVRQSLESINPAGYKSIGFIQRGDQRHLYERCHLIAHSLEGEEANAKNLFTGTAELNERMYTYEEKAAKYLQDNQNCTLLYSVTPEYAGDNLLPSYVIMEATGTGINKDGKNVNEQVFCVKIYNTALGWNIDYKTGEATQK